MTLRGEMPCTLSTAACSSVRVRLMLDPDSLFAKQQGLDATLIQDKTRYQGPAALSLFMTAAQPAATAVPPAGMQNLAEELAKRRAAKSTTAPQFHARERRGTEVQVGISACREAIRTLA